MAAASAAVKGTKVELYLSDSFYPAGDEQNLVFSITGKTVPTGGIPLDVGCVVSNVSTVLNIAHAMEGTPVTDKLVTVGGAVARPVTVSAPIGTPLSKLLDAAGGAIGDCTFIVGGPLMGKLTDDLSQSVTKTTGGLLAIPRNHPIVAKRPPPPGCGHRPGGVQPVQHVHSAVSPQCHGPECSAPQGHAGAGLRERHADR